MAKSRRTQSKRGRARVRKAPVRRRALKRAPAKSVRKQKTAGPASAHHAVRMKPFSSATQQPKIPDGALTSSLARRMQHVFQLRNGDGSLGTDIMHLVFAPTLGVPLLAINSETGVTLRGGSGADPSFHGFSGQNVNFELQPVGGGTVESIPATTGSSRFEVHNECGFSKWRIISQGLRLELTNNDEQNEGWFEACRFNWRRKNGDLCLTPLDGTTTDTELGCAPAHQNLEYLEPMSMVEQPGYKTGLLKDLKKYEFMLHPQSSTHDPVVLDQQFNLTEDKQYTIDTNARTMRLKDGDDDAGRLKDQMVDANMDWLYIRLHPRVNNGSSSNGSALLTSIIQNIEVAFDPASDFATFQTTNVRDKKTAQFADAINNNPDSFMARSK